MEKRTIIATCPVCKNKFIQPKAKRHKKTYCSQACANEAIKKPLAEKVARNYRVVKILGRGWIGWHRLVVEEQMGKELGPHIQVHHIDKNTANNRPENLVALTKGEHYICHALDRFGSLSRGARIWIEHILREKPDRAI